MIRIRGPARGGRGLGGRAGDLGRRWSSWRAWRAAAGHELDADDFMTMGVTEAATAKVRLNLYKHIDRRYLNLDDGGRAYGYVPPNHPTDEAGYGPWDQQAPARLFVLDRGEISECWTTLDGRQHP